jgi:hypothetical protein
MTQRELWNELMQSRDAQGKRIMRLMADAKPKTTLDIIYQAHTTSPHRRMTELRLKGFNITHAIKGGKYNWYVWLRDELTEQQLASLITSAETGKI